jgi:RNA recognition motif-containing protein
MSYDTSEDDLRKAFEAHGTVDSVAVISDQYSGRSKGFGFVEMNNDEEAKAAIESLNDSDLQGRTLKVNQARPRNDNRGGGGRGGGFRRNY